MVAAAAELVSRRPCESTGDEGGGGGGGPAGEDLEALSSGHSNMASAAAAAVAAAVAAATDDDDDNNQVKVVSEPDLSSWDQRETLLPPPYQGPLKRYMKGIHVGDPQFDCESKQALLRLAHGGSPVQNPEPEWVDWDSVRRGQAHWCRLLGPTFVALNAALLQGFTIARFAEVLVIAGYTASRTATWNRFRNTGWAIMDWLHHPLDDPASDARKSIYTVRCMHAYARRIAKDARLFSEEKGEGIPLSQYDLAEVLMGFSVICLSILEIEFGFGEFPKKQRQDMYHCWRLIGYHLGILDEFNVCASMPELERCLGDYMEWTPARLRTCRASTHELQHAVCDAFGVNTGMGTQWYRGLVCELERARNWDIKYTRITCFPGLRGLIGAAVSEMGNSPNYVRHMGMRLTRIRHRWKHSPQQARAIEVYVAKPLAICMDYIGWPAATVAYKLWIYLAWLYNDSVKRRVLMLLCALALLKPFRGFRRTALKSLLPGR